MNTLLFHHRFWLNFTKFAFLLMLSYIVKTYYATPFDCLFYCLPIVLLYLIRSFFCFYLQVDEYKIKIQNYLLYYSLAITYNEICTITIREKKGGGFQYCKLTVCFNDKKARNFYMQHFTKNEFSSMRAFLRVKNINAKYLRWM
jgi:hypothetical protein